jgi:hypothetical protein
MKIYSLGILFLFSSCILNAQSIEEIRAINFKSLGGEKQNRSLFTLETIGKLKSDYGQLPIRIYQKHEEGYLQEFEYKGSKNFIIVNKEASYNFMPIQGMKSPKQEDENKHRFLSNMLDIQDDLKESQDVFYKVVGHLIILDKEVVKLLKYRNGRFEKAIYFYIESMLKAREEIPINPENMDESIYLSLDEFSSKEYFTQVTYDKYQKTKEGYVMPFWIQTNMGLILVDQYIFNKELKKDIFNLPSTFNKTK